jgi:putative hydroxymethylpyrimidine transporter CytX
MKKIKNSSMFLLWAGAAISITEIYTGGIIAPLGLKKGLLAIIIGHIIGTAFLAFGGYISFVDNKNAMDKVRDSMGSVGAKIIAFLNILQLIGWAAIMIIQGGRALNSVIPGLSFNIALIFMAVAVFIWAYSFNNYSKLVNDISVVVLIIVCILMFFKVHGAAPIAIKDSISFTTAIELAIAMPVSWLPLIGDYAKDGESKTGVFIWSFWGYFIGSVLMYVLGLLITVKTGKDVIEFIAGTGLSLVASLIIVLSTVTTTFLDIFSAVISSKQIFKVKSENILIIIYSIIATIIAFIFPIENYQNFLLTIGSIFVPVYIIVFAEYAMGRNWNAKSLNVLGLITAVLGTLLYNYFNKLSFGIPTVLVFVILTIIYYLPIKLLKRSAKNDK